MKAVCLGMISKAGVRDRRMKQGRKASVCFLNENKGMFLRFGGNSWGAYNEMQLRTLLYGDEVGSTFIIHHPRLNVVILWVNVSRLLGQPSWEALGQTSGPRRGPASCTWRKVVETHREATATVMTGVRCGAVICNSRYPKLLFCFAE